MGGHVISAGEAGIRAGVSRQGVREKTNSPLLASGQPWQNMLIYGDNLQVLRTLGTETTALPGQLQTELVS